MRLPLPDATSHPALDPQRRQEAMQQRVRSMRVNTGSPACRSAAHSNTCACLPTRTLRLPTMALTMAHTALAPSSPSSADTCIIQGATHTATEPSPLMGAAPPAATCCNCCLLQLLLMLDATMPTAATPLLSSCHDRPPHGHLTLPSLLCYNEGAKIPHHILHHQSLTYHDCVSARHRPRPRHLGAIRAKGLQAIYGRTTELAAGC